MNTQRKNSPFQQLLNGQVVRKQIIVGGIMLVALLAFEMFNFDTTKYALNSLLGEVRFAGLQWATILAIAFCAIDFAGLARLFTPEQGKDEPKEVWYLMGAWFLGATMNAVMTWWAVSLTLLNHSFGNEVLSRAELLRYVPIFVAVLVWLTRILFIGSLTVAGEQIIWGDQRKRSSKGSSNSRAVAPAAQRSRRAVPKPKPSYQPRAPQAAMSADSHDMGEAAPAYAAPAAPRPAMRTQPMAPRPVRAAGSGYTPAGERPAPRPQPRRHNNGRPNGMPKQSNGLRPGQAAAD